MALSPVELQCSTILLAAASATFGLVVRTNSPYKARAMLYRVRKELGDTTLEGLHIRVSPDDTEGAIWVIRRNQAAPFSISALTAAEELL
jgi:hypothetical protein